MNAICNLSSFPTQTFLLLCSHLYSLASIHKNLTKITEWSPYLSLWWANPPTYPVHKWQYGISKILAVNNFFLFKTLQRLHTNTSYPGLLCPPRSVTCLLVQCHLLLLSLFPPLLQSPWLPVHSWNTLSSFLLHGFSQAVFSACNSLTLSPNSIPPHPVFSNGKFLLGHWLKCCLFKEAILI